MKKLIKPILFILCLLPLLGFLFRFSNHKLSANPISDLTNMTGITSLRILTITLFITPLRQIFHWNGLIRYRRMIGLFAFFYGTLHMLTYVWLDKFFDLNEIINDVARRPFITLGSLAFVAMIPLAMTSNQIAIQKLKHHWQTLHRLIYLSAVAGVVHFFWLVKADKSEPITYMCIISGLLLFRLVRSIRN